MYSIIYISSSYGMVGRNNIVYLVDDEGNLLTDNDGLFLVA